MKLLVSPISLDEAVSIIDAGADIIDIKNVNEGSLGAQFPWKITEIVRFVQQHGILTSATLGDLPFKPGTASQAAYGVALCGVNYIKVGLYGLNTYDQAVEMMTAVQRAVRMVSDDLQVVASGYADYKRFDGLNPSDLVKAAKTVGCDGVMVDTAFKDGPNLFDALTLDEIRHFVDLAKEANMFVALAGSIKASHAEKLLEIGPDIIGVRGALCGGPDRHSKISVERTKDFIRMFRREPVEQA